jgi:Uma2 family endonuclease
MATHLISNTPAPDYTDDSRFERIDVRWVERPVPVEKHADVQFAVAQILQQKVSVLGGKARPEWSLVDPATPDQPRADYMIPDVVAALPPIRRANNGYLLPPAFLAVEIRSPNQSGLIQKAERYISWGIEHVWIIDPDSRECLEYHGGNTIIIARDALHAGDIAVSIEEIFAGIDSSVSPETPS